MVGSRVFPRTRKLSGLFHKYHHELRPNATLSLPSP